MVGQALHTPGGCIMLGVALLDVLGIGISGQWLLGFDMS